MAVEVQVVACANEAGFVMSFGVEILDPETGGQLLVEGVDSGEYPIAQTRALDLATTGIAEGTWVRPRVYAVWGTSDVGNRFVRFAKNDETATYEVRGTTLSYGVQLIGSP